jgi:hypothetical protein
MTEIARRQFDIWIGSWDCTWEGGDGTNVVTAELNGIVTHERFGLLERPKTRAS